MTDNLDGLFSPFLRDRRIKAARPFLQGSVLDYGCGIGLVGAFVEQKDYVGVDIDQSVLAIARQNYPAARFYTPQEFRSQIALTFDTIVGLAIVEHVDDPLDFLSEMAARLSPSGRIVLTTPHPSLEWILHVGDKLGLFSKASHEEHNVILDRKLVFELARKAGLTTIIYKRFLLGANQLIVFEI